MILKTLRMRGFRAHEETRASFAPKVNLIYGPNGAGKTNLLEAVHYLCLTKSFEASSDTYVLRKGAPYFEVEGSFEGGRGRDLRIRVAYVPDEGKRAFINGAPVERLADVVGRVPVVALTPGDKALTAGGPEERRRFVNNILSQAHRVYLDDMMKYRRVLRQRNALLFHAKKNGRSSVPTLDAWSEELVDLGSRITEARLEFVEEFRAYLRRAYGLFEDIEEEPGLKYVCVAAGKNREAKSTRERFRDAIEEARPREIARGRTAVGPHRDELVFRIDNMEVRRYASQGQHRTFGMALKLATYYYLEEHLEERPIFLLDDVFGDLDTRRTAAFLEILRSDAVGQSLITGAAREGFEAEVPFEKEEHRTMRVEKGRITGRRESGP